MRVYISNYLKLLEEFETHVKDFNNLTHEEIKSKFNEVYGHTVIVDDLGTLAYVEMSDHDYTLFLLKYS